MSDEVQSVPFALNEEHLDNAPNSSTGGEHDSAAFDSSLIIILVMLMVYMLFEAYKHKSGVVFGHEASLVTLLGMCISSVFLYNEMNDQLEHFKFSGELFFYIVLPPIVFASGFNMYRKKFFSNLTNIVLFGIFGTFIAFFSFSGFTVLFTNTFQLH